MTNLRTLPALAALALGCSGTQHAPTNSAATVSSGSPELRTVDNAGFVDAAGRTRQVSAGVGQEQVGRGSEVAPPRREEPSGSPAAATPEPSTGSVYVGEVIARAARALCDRETVCGRVGDGKEFPSADSCMAEKRERVNRAASAASCKEVKSNRIAACLQAIRGSECGAPGEHLAPPPACTAATLCE